MEPFMAFRPGIFRSILMNFATGLTEDFGNQNSRYDCSTHAWLTPQSKLLSFVHSHFENSMLRMDRFQFGRQPRIRSHRISNNFFFLRLSAQRVMSKLLVGLRPVSGADFLPHSW